MMRGYKQEAHKDMRKYMGWMCMGKPNQIFIRSQGKGGGDPWNSWPTFIINEIQVVNGVNRRRTFLKKKP